MFYSQSSKGIPLSCICISKIPSLKRSPTSLAAIIENMIGNPREMSPVASVIITVKLSVMRTIPPRVEAAPIKAYFPGSTAAFGNKIAMPMPTKRPLKNKYGKIMI